MEALRMKCHGSDLFDSSHSGFIVPRLFSVSVMKISCKGSRHGSWRASNQPKRKHSDPMRCFGCRHVDERNHRPVANLLGDRVLPRIMPLCMRDLSRGQKPSCSQLIADLCAWTGAQFGAILNNDRRSVIWRESSQGADPDIPQSRAPRSRH
jgi:hypothetical protein